MKQKIRILEDLVPLQCIGHKETVNYKEAMDKEWMMCLECNGFICPECALLSQNEMNEQCPNGFFEERRPHQLKTFPISPRVIIREIERACEQRKNQLAPLINIIDGVHEDLNQVWSELMGIRQQVRNSIQALEWVHQFFHRRPSPLEMLEQQATILRMQMEQQSAKIAMAAFPSMNEVQHRLSIIEDQIEQVKTFLESFKDLKDPDNRERLSGHVKRLRQLELSLTEKKNQLITLFKDLKNLKKDIQGKEEQEDQRIMATVREFLESVVQRTLRNARISTQRIEPFIKLNKALAAFLPQLLVGGSDIERYQKDVQATVNNIQSWLMLVKNDLSTAKVTLADILESPPHAKYIDKTFLINSKDSKVELLKVSRQKSPHLNEKMTEANQPPSNSEEHSEHQSSRTVVTRTPRIIVKKDDGKVKFLDVSE